MIRLIISEIESGQGEALADRLAASEEIEVLGYARDGLEAAQMAVQLSPDVALIHADLPGLDGFEACQMVSVATPDTAVVILVEDGESVAQFQQRAMRAGARDILSTNVSAERLAEVVREVAVLKELKQQSEYQLISDPTRMPVTIAVTGAKGGTGKTTIATNLAVNLQQRFPEQVVLVDFIGQYGDVALMLDLPQSEGLVDLAAQADLDLDVVESYLQTHSCGLKVLAAPPMGEISTEANPVTVSYLAALLGLLRRSYRFVVFDIPPVVERASSYIFSRCNYIVVVTYLLDLSAIRDTAALLEGLAAMKMPAERIKLVVNRTGHNSPFTISDLQQATQWTPAVQIPEDTATVTGAVNEGIPVMLGAPNCAVAKSIRELTESIVAELLG